MPVTTVKGEVIGVAQTLNKIDGEWDEDKLSSLLEELIADMAIDTTWDNNGPLTVPEHYPGALCEEVRRRGGLILVGMIVLYILLGLVMDSLSMILLTVPIFWPIIAGLDFQLQGDDLKLWFGIITLIVVEVGLITPPVGLNVFVINSMARCLSVKASTVIPRASAPVKPC